ncbi:alpha/beta hydrolase [Arthrobacter mobilis]|uniref:Alpha/beta hydrolase n=1 Tax=Arthrobacter mobilis TaxID=2724944 RepID=A0A7X6HCJ8_9MICC|nr:alpha/beta hydrolase [Arthrobacter mobilis]NKX54015.1 alpha/beta hydrolase [Arthrobacter mobilis]
MQAVWQPDILGPDFESAVLRVPSPAVPGQQATLVRYVPDAAEPLAGRQALLFLHGWSDYFFNTELARFWHRLGVAFYALDMHNYGRSLRDGDLPGFAADLADYDAEITLALSAVREDLARRSDLRRGPGGAPEAARVTLMGHSTGGLVAALWAGDHPGLIQSLVLNSPWLEMHRSPLVRHAAASVIHPLSRVRPAARLWIPSRGFYYRSISKSAEGEWEPDPVMRPPGAFPIHAGWLSAVWRGQARVARGLGIEVPVLVLASGRSMNGPVWHEDMKAADVVLDVETMAARAVKLGRSVTLERIDGALHDVFLSRAPVRREAYARLRRWAGAYMLDAGEPDNAASTAAP